MTVKVKCINCNEPVTEFAVECPKCGKPVANKDAPTNVADLKFRTDSSHAKKSPLIPIVIIIIVVIALAIFYFLK